MPKLLFSSSSLRLYLVAASKLWVLFLQLSPAASYSLYARYALAFIELVKVQYANSVKVYIFLFAVDF